MSAIDQFPTVRKAAMLIALDNGLINRFCSEETWIGKVEGAIFADGVPQHDVRMLENFLLTLSEEDLETLCCGEHSEMVAVEANAPMSVVEPDMKVTRLLNDIFEA